jgi:hypothetical protein
MNTNNRKSLSLAVAVLLLAIVFVSFSSFPSADAYSPSSVGVRDTGVEIVEIVEIVVVSPSTTVSNGAHDPRPDACRTYAFGGYDATDGVACEAVYYRAVVKVVVDATTTITPVTPVVVVNTPPVVVVPPVVDISTKKQHCNNGNGNGAEGCNASDKGNEDETEVKGDKAVDHPDKKNKNK